MQRATRPAAAIGRGTAVAKSTSVKTRLLVHIPKRLAPLVRANRRLFAGVVVMLSMAMWTAVGTSAWFLHDVVTGLPDNASIRQVGTMAQATLLLDLDDKPAFTIFREQRIDVPLSGISPHLVRAIVAIEDQRFYEHSGVDLVRVAGAAVSNLREGRRAQGGSTLTQQLARQSFLTPDKTVRRKLKEIIVAARLEREFSKEHILQLYLNKVYFGDGLYGVEAASLGFFGKRAAELSLPEAALLAGLVKNPSSYAPTVSRDRALARRNLVLQQMLESRVIDRAEYENATSSKVTLSDALRREESFGLYFKEEVRKELVERFGWERVYQGGLKVFTTIDPRMQKAAESEVARALESIEKRRPKRKAQSEVEEPPLQAALVAMDPHTGEVRALVGGRDFSKSSFNRATQARRQPGSAFKPFVYAAALEAGYSPAALLTNLDEPVMTLQGEWVPEDEHLESPTMTMRTALRISSNRAAVKMLEEVGIPKAVQSAKLLGVGDVPSVPSLALGSGEVTLLSMTAAYGAFANKGMLPVATLIRRVETADGTVLFESKAEQQRAVSESTAYLMTTMMADVINSGTAWTARREGFTLPAAGKTGTTNEYHDAWFVGYTPKLVSGVWVGFDQPKTIIGGGYAAELAVPLWGRFMTSATRGHRAEWFSPPGNIVSATICLLSGQLAREGCRDTVTVDAEGKTTRRSMEYTELFVRGTEPSEYCTLHGPGAHTHGVGQAATLGDTEDRAAPSELVRPSTPATIGVTQVPPAPVPPPPPTEADKPKEPEKKRGFWGRIFGR
jgi:1A family penicillin-binding protein